MTALFGVKQKIIFPFCEFLITFCHDIFGVQNSIIFNIYIISQLIKKPILLNYFLKGCFTFICDFHREQAWDRWLRKTTNSCVKVRKEVLQMLRRIVRSYTEKEAEYDMKKSKIWNSPEYSK